jgi:hypothetical protein
MSLATGKDPFCLRISTSFRGASPFLPNQATLQSHFIATIQAENKEQASRMIEIPKKVIMNKKRGK